MADTKITSKNDFATAAATLKTKLSSLKSDSDTVASKAKSASNYDGIDVSGAAQKLANNFKNIYTDFENATNNINNYATDILGFDVNDFLAKGGEVPISYEDLFKSDGSMEGNAQVVWNFLKYKGLSDAAAAGVMGNIQAESNFRLDALGDRGTSYGLIQWHNGRWTNLKNYCSQHGLDPSSLQGQLEFLWAESLDPNTGYGKSLASKGFYTTTSAVDAAVAFHDAVEKSASSREGVINKRGGYATKWYNQLQGSGPGNVDGSVTLSSKKWTSLVNGKTTATNTGAYVSSGSRSSGGCGYYAPTSSAPTTTVTTTSTTTPTTVTTTTTETTTTEITVEISRKDQIDKMEAIKAEKVKLDFGDKKVDTSKFSDNPELGLKVTTGHLSYELTEDDVDLLCSIVAASGGKGYDDSLSIISSILNRCENTSFMDKYGVDPIAQVTASNEFDAYGNGDFKSYLNGTSEISDEVREAVKAALSGVRNHSKTNVLDLVQKVTSGTTSTSTEVTESTGGLLESLRKSNDEFVSSKVEDGVDTLVTDDLMDDTSSGSQELEELGIKAEGDSIIAE